jgi:CTP-dependent riboflavin kinase
VAVDRELTGIVIPGRGLGSVRMAHSHTLARIEELVGFSLVPGTLNVRLPGHVEPSLISSYLAAAEISPGWETETAQAGYFLVPVLVAGRYRGVAFQADEPGYPADQVELVCEVHLRDTLGLSDGDPITFSVPRLAG